MRNGVRRPILIIVADTEVDYSTLVERVYSTIAEAVEAGSLPKWGMPDDVKLVPQIEKTSVGKIKKTILRARYK